MTGRPGNAPPGPAPARPGPPPVVTAGPGTSGPPPVVTAWLVTGFTDQDALDVFVKAEIRYFKSMEMRVLRCEGPSLWLEMEDLPGLRRTAAAVARRWSALELVVTGGLPPVRLAGDTEIAIERIPDRPRVLEEIYSTF